jgi:hypothetical protein
VVLRERKAGTRTAERRLVELERRMEAISKMFLQTSKISILKSGGREHKFLFLQAKPSTDVDVVEWNVE